MKRKTCYKRYDVGESSGRLSPPDNKQDWRIIYFNNTSDPSQLFVVWECWVNDN